MKGVNTTCSGVARHVWCVISHLDYSVMAPGNHSHPGLIKSGLLSILSLFTFLLLLLWLTNVIFLDPHVQSFLSSGWTRVCAVFWVLFFKYWSDCVTSPVFSILWEPNCCPVLRSVQQLLPQEAFNSKSNVPDKTWTFRQKEKESSTMMFIRLKLKCSDKIDNLNICHHSNTNWMVVPSGHSLVCAFPWAPTSLASTFQDWEFKVYFLGNDFDEDRGFPLLCARQKSPRMDGGRKEDSKQQWE